tara:strand:+ start:123 stop:371 length:249 start_codon:yes stop_codon:yes gene_type:complete
MYTIELTSEDLTTIAFVGHRYGWSAALLPLAHEGLVSISEPESWEIREAIDSDMEGGHDAFPMLDKRSVLADKLYNLYMSME